MVRVQEGEMRAQANGLRLKNQCGSAAACVFDRFLLLLFSFLYTSFCVCSRHVYSFVSENASVSILKF